MTTCSPRMPYDQSDAQLVELARAGAPAAFDALVQRFKRVVHGVAFAVVAEREAALDILQESWIAAYRQLHTLEEPAKFGPWVCAIARNQARQYLRHHVRQQARELPLSTVEEMAAPASTDEQLGYIRAALTLLTSPQADIIVLFYMEGYTIRECVRMLGVPEGTVKRRLHDARQRLKKELMAMVKAQLREFALPEDYHVVIDKPGRLYSSRTTLAWFQDRWVLLWQDGRMWGKEYWACDQFEYWLAESRDGREWTTPRQLAFAEVPYPDARTFHLSQSFVHRGRLYLHTYRHENGIDLYSSADMERWTAHPRLCLPGTGRSALFGDERYLYVTYPSWIENAQVQGDRVDVMRSADGGNTWLWLKSPVWPQQGITDAAGLVVGGRFYLAWRGHDRNTAIPNDQLPQHVSLIWSEDNGLSWSTPRVVQPLTIEKRASVTLRFASIGSTLAIAQEVRQSPGNDTSEIWVVISQDSGLTWSEKAVYNAESLLDPAIAFTSAGTLVLAGSSRHDQGSQPWFIRSGITVNK